MIFAVDYKISMDNLLLIFCQIVCYATDVPIEFGIHPVGAVIQKCDTGLSAWRIPGIKLFMTFISFSTDPYSGFCFGSKSLQVLSSHTNTPRPFSTSTWALHPLGFIQSPHLGEEK